MKVGKLRKLITSAGFTLMEILISVIVVGVLTGLALPQFNIVIERQRAKEAEYFLRAMGASVDAYRVENGGSLYPLTMDLLGVSAPSSFSNFTNLTYTMGGAPTDPPSVSLLRSNGTYRLVLMKNPATGRWTVTCTHGLPGTGGLATCMKLGYGIVA